MVNLNVVKSADRQYVFLGMSNKIRYSIIITNTGTSKAIYTKLRDFLGEGACFIPGSMTINGCKQNVLGLDYDISLGAIPPGGNTIISFEVKITPGANISQITNQAVVIYCDEEGNVGEVVSNLLVLPVIKISVCIQKTADKTKVMVGEVISYSVMIRNESNLPIENVIFYDEVSPSLEILPGTVMINMTPQFIVDFTNGLDLGTLQPHSSVVVSFQAQVISYPIGGIITNCARVEYEYTVILADVPEPIVSIGEACSDLVKTCVVNETITC